MGFFKRLRKRRQERKAAEQAALSMFDSNGNVAMVAGCMPSTRMPSLMHFQAEQEHVKREEVIASSSLSSNTAPHAQHRSTSGGTSNTFTVEDDEDDRSNSAQSERSNSRNRMRESPSSFSPEDSEAWTTPTKSIPVASASQSFPLPEDDSWSANSSRSRLSLPGTRTMTKARADFWQHQAFNSTPIKRENSPSPSWAKADTPSSAASSHSSQFTSTTTSTPNTSSTAITTPISNVQKKRQWLQKAFSPEGAANMTSKASEEKSPDSPPNLSAVQFAQVEEDYYFMESSAHISSSKKIASSKQSASSKKSKEMDSEQHGTRENTTTTTAETASATDKDTRIPLEEQKTVAEVKRIAPSPQFSASSLGSVVPERQMDDYEAYCVWYAKGLLKWAPTKPPQQQEQNIEDRHEVSISEDLDEDKTEKANRKNSIVRVRTVIDDSDDSSATDDSEGVADFYDDSEDIYPTFNSRDDVLQHTEHLLMEMDSSTAASSKSSDGSNSTASSPDYSPDSSSHSGVRAVIPSLMDTVHEASHSATDDDSDVEVSPEDCNVSDLTAPTPPREQLIKSRSKELCESRKSDDLQIPEDTSTTQQESTEESTSSSAHLFESAIESVRLQWQVQEYIDVIREHRHLVREKSRQAPILSLFGTTKSDDLLQAQAVTAKSHALQNYAKNFQEYKKQRLEQRRLREEQRREKEEEEQIQQTKEALAWLEALKQQMLIQHTKETAAQSSTASGTATAAMQ